MKATVAMPKPGKAPLKRFHLVKGPVYLHSSLNDVEYFRLPKRLSGHGKTHIRCQGSFNDFREEEDEAAASLRMSNPVRFVREGGAMML